MSMKKSSFRATKEAKKKKPKLRVRKVQMAPTEVVRIIVVRIIAHKDIVHQAVVHKAPGVVEIVPVTRPADPLKKPGTWWKYLFGDV
jgi:hypothetical protein